MKFVQCGRLLDATDHGEAWTEVTVVIENGRFAEIRPGWHSGDGETVDLRNWTVIPGIVNSHDHLTIEFGDGRGAATAPLLDRLWKGVHLARDYVRRGITVLRDAGARDSLNVELEKAISSGAITGPRVIPAGTPITSSGGHGWFLSRQADGAEAVRQAVREQARDGAKFIKIIPTGGVTTPHQGLVSQCMDREEILAACQTARSLGLPIAAHAYGGSAIEDLLDGGVTTIEHGSFLTDAQLHRMDEQKTWLVSTVGVMRAGGRASHIPEFMRQKFAQSAEQYVETLSRARKIGIRLAAGTDTYHGDDAVALEFDALLGAGYQPWQALQALTLWGARLLGQDSQIGTVEAGKLADLVALDGDPLSDGSALSRVKRVVMNGAVMF